MRPDLTVAAVIERDGEFLFVEERVGVQLVFNQPAGHVERGEALIDAVVRETLEETAWTFEPEALLGVYLWEQPEKERSFLRFAFCGRVTAHDPRRRLDRGIRRALWMTRDELAARSDRLRSPMVMRCVDDYRAGHRYPLDVLRMIASDPAAALNAEAAATPLTRLA